MGMDRTLVDEDIYIYIYGDLGNKKRKYMK